MYLLSIDFDKFNFMKHKNTCKTEQGMMQIKKCMHKCASLYRSALFPYISIKLSFEKYAVIKHNVMCKKVGITSNESTVTCIKDGSQVMIVLSRV